MAGRINYFGNIVSNGLITDLDAAKFDSYPKTGTRWYDITWSTSGGTLTNGPTFSSDNGGNIVFDGINDYVDCGFLTIDYSTSFTSNVWFKLSALNRYHTIIGYGDGQVSPYYYWMIIVNSSNFIQFWAYDGLNRSISYNVSLNSTSWYNATITYNYGNCILYLNGVPVTSGNTPTINRVDSARYTRIGYNTWANGANNYLSGNVSTTQIYNRILTSTEVLQNYNAVKGRYGL